LLDQTAKIMPPKQSASDSGNVKVVARIRPSNNVSAAFPPCHVPSPSNTNAQHPTQQLEKKKGGTECVKLISQSELEVRQKSPFNLMNKIHDSLL
jgi:hypothetical protein